jgi:predicted NUDIX family NTP pyrophosphohydrolase
LRGVSRTAQAFLKAGLKEDAALPPCGASSVGPAGPCPAHPLAKVRESHLPVTFLRAYAYTISGVYKFLLFVHDAKQACLPSGAKPGITIFQILLSPDLKKNLSSEALTGLYAAKTSQATTRPHGSCFTVMAYVMPGKTTSKIQSGGVLLFLTGKDLQVFLGHPGGPFWSKKDLGVWTIPKGLIAPGEDSLAVAQREFAEETGHGPQGEFISPGAAKQPDKVVHIWAVQGDWDADQLRSNTFEMQWPPKSGRRASAGSAARTDGCLKNGPLLRAVLI